MAKSSRSERPVRDVAPSISIEAIARHDRAMMATVETLHAAETSHKASKSVQDFARCQRASSLIDARQDAIHDLIVALPARTMADAVVQVGQAMFFVDRMHDGVPEGQDNGDTTALRRILASIFPLMAAAAGVDPHELVEEWCFNRWGEEFGGLERAMAGDTP